MYYRRWNRGNYQEHCSAWRRISGRDRNEYGGEAIWEVGWRQARLEAFCLVRAVKTDTTFAWCTSCTVQQSMSCFMASRPETGRLGTVVRRAVLFRESVWYGVRGPDPIGVLKGCELGVGVRRWGTGVEPMVARFGGGFSVPPMVNPLKPFLYSNAPLPFLAADRVTPHQPGLALEPSFHPRINRVLVLHFPWTSMIPTER
ncbi:uncharacterized protein EV420DRAFT_1488344 [Desarmillaria tabescens]|uniref:Uncharacterized protein n=1 Tax=Armillaria tabescens TaxID=1929756 RepID=A0AA39J2L3_ARMTA|nr:uncharacterized protein EV420DRAFT_1488344 [Desarmillaria tabescens]KAK0434976.1 hypothetical protein EV420DRAFT_1488344 [Desarmillaria tabescens]